MPSRRSKPAARRSTGLQIEAGGPAWYHPGRSGTIKLGPKTVLGHFGEFHPKTLEGLDVSGPLCGFEVFVDAVPEPKAKPTRTKPKLDLSAFQAVKRDFAFVVDKTVEAGTLSKAALAADRKLITGVSVFDVFEGASLGEGKKSIAIEVSIQPVEKTLTDEDFEALAGRIVENVGKQTGGVLRARYSGRVCMIMQSRQGLFAIPPAFRRGVLPMIPEIVRGVDLHLSAIIALASTPALADWLAGKVGDKSGPWCFCRSERSVADSKEGLLLLRDIPPMRRRGSGPNSITLRGPPDRASAEIGRRPRSASATRSNDKVQVRRARSAARAAPLSSFYRSIEIARRANLFAYPLPAPSPPRCSACRPPYPGVSARRSPRLPAALSTMPAAAMFGSRLAIFRAPGIGTMKSP